MNYLVLKAIHIIAVLAWTAALFYIGRIFVYYAEASHPETKTTLGVMAKKLSLYIMLPASIIATLIGLHLIGVVQAMAQPWFHLKLTLLILLFGYQHLCHKFTKQIRNNQFTKSSKWLRLFNEVPIILIIGIVFAVITKDIPFTLIAMAIPTAALGIFFTIKKT